MLSFMFDKPKFRYFKIDIHIIKKYNYINSNEVIIMKNNKGFIAISIIFSFFIVFLMLITLVISTYGQNRILMNQVKKDIKANINFELRP